jgi:predicted MFS family arabinose efflux permease
LAGAKPQAGLVASANYLGYFIGALPAARPFASAQPRRWLLTALAASAMSTAGMALPSEIASFIGLRFVGGIWQAPLFGFGYVITATFSCHRPAYE